MCNFLLCDIRICDNPKNYMFYAESVGLIPTLDENGALCYHG